MLKSRQLTRTSTRKGYVYTNVGTLSPCMYETSATEGYTRNAGSTELQSGMNKNLKV